MLKVLHSTAKRKHASDKGPLYLYSLISDIPIVLVRRGELGGVYPVIRYVAYIYNSCDPSDTSGQIREYVDEAVAVAETIKNTEEQGWYIVNWGR